MDHAQRWTALLSRIGPEDAHDLDALLVPFDPRAAVKGQDVFPEISGCLMPTTAMKREDTVAIGLAVETAPPDAADRALRAAAFAMERDAEVVILSHVDRSGFERFGFRVERIAGATPAARAACEDQIRRFWNIELVLPAAPPDRAG